MNQDQLIDKVLEYNKLRKKIDTRPTWKRLLSSLRISLKMGKNLRQPVASVYVKGKVEF